MKKLAAIVLSLAAVAAAVILSFEFFYKFSPNEFITDRTTFIYSNKNLNEEKIEKFEKIFEINNTEEKNILEKVDSIYILSQSKLYNENVKMVGVVDTGFYYPLMLMKLKEYFNYRSDYFYELKDDMKKEIGLSKDDDIYLKPYRGLFFIGTDTESVNRIIHGDGKKSLNVVEILNARADSDLGTLVFNQERERILGIDRVVISGNIEDNVITLDGSVYGDNNFIKDLSMQPAVRRMNKYITDNRIYFSTSNIRMMDTFILRAISSKEKTAKPIKLMQELFAKGSAEIFSQLNGEMVMDLENGNYLLGLKNSENTEKYVEYFKNDDDINIEKDREGNIYICIGDDTFVPVKKIKEITPNQFFSGKVDTYYGKLEVNGFYETDSLRIKAKIELNEKIIKL